MIDDPDKPSEVATATSLSLLERAKANDNAAWERLRSLYVPLVHKWCRQGGVDQADIPDVGQEVFLAVSINLVRFRRDRQGDTFRGWIRVITRNKIADMQRARRGISPAFGGSDALEQLQAIPQPEEPQDDESEKSEVKILYQRAIDIVTTEYPAWYKEAFLRVVAGGERPADVAADLGIRTSAVHNATSRILRQLRDEFAEALE